MFWLILFLISITVILIGIFLVRRYEKHKHLIRSLNLRLLLIKLPQVFSQKENSSSGRGWKEEINLSAQLFSVLSSIKDEIIFEAAVPNLGEEINFYLTVPRGKEEFAMRQIQGLWKDAQVDLVSDFNIFHPEGVVAAAYLKQRNSYFLPIRTYLEAEVDTFSGILSNLSKVEISGEGLALQVIWKVAAASSRKNILSAREKLMKGESLDNVSSSGSFWKIFKEIIFHKKKDDKSLDEKKSVDVEVVKALESKIAKPLFGVNIRLVASAPSKMRADELLEGLVGSFAQFAAPQRNEFKIVKPKNPAEFLSEFSFREFNEGESMILNSEELASLYHLPSSSINVPHVKWLRAREAQPPENLPKNGTLIGDSFFRGKIIPVYITEEDRRRHIYIVGQTGTGKTTAIINMAISDIKNGKGVGIIDPHGDLVKAILRNIPQNRVGDVILFDPGDLEKPVGLNMLEYDRARPEEKTFIVNEIQGIFNRLFLAETMGPMFEQYMRNALLLLMDNPDDPATLVEVPRIFTDASFRAEKLSKATTSVVIDFWEKEAVKTTGEHSLSSMTPYITSKFNNFIANDYVRPIIGQPKSAFNFRNVMDEGKIVLVNLSKGRIGDINAGLLGMIITGKFLMAALSRGDISENKRRDFNLYIDEFQNFTTDSISTILSEARKYRLNLVMAHQFIAQLTEKIRDSVFGNVGSIIALRVGPQDAEFLIKQFEPIFTVNDLINIDNFNAYAKLLIHGTTVLPFNIKIKSPELGDNEHGEKVREYSRTKYGHDRIEIEASILERLRRSNIDLKKAKEGVKEVSSLL